MNTWDRPRRTRWFRLPGARKLLATGLWGLAAAAILLPALCFLFPFDVSRLESYPASSWVTASDGTWLRAYRSGDDEFRFVNELDEISDWLELATIAVEDRNFHSHHGVDFPAVARAAWQNLVRMRVHSGASTLTMQLVRILDQRPRTISSKIIEAFYALQIAARLDKDAILAAYLNLAPYGGNLRGVEAAARRYLGKSAADLSLGEAALLAGLPQGPSRLRPDRHYERALARRQVVLEAMLREGMIDKARFGDAIRSRPQVKLHAWPFEAPHFSDLARYRARALGRAPGRIRTVLDSGVQVTVRAHLDDYLRRHEDRFSGLGLAVVVVEVDSGAVRAMVGSPAFFDSRLRGQYNAALARRSSGSTLKPFLYALAFDLRKSSPAAFLPDVPSPFAAYVPQNYSRRYHGPVPASKALARSMNIPAVRLQGRVGTRRYLDVLRQAGFNGLYRRPRDYGMTLCLGGGEVSLLELVGAYTVFPGLGTWRPPFILDGKDPPRSQRRRIFSAGSAATVLDALSTEDHLSRSGVMPAEYRGPRLGYKTGTSFGLRDAWTVAFSSSWVVGVWMGDVSGRSRPGLIGGQAALPLALPLCMDLSEGTAPGWPRTRELVERDVCSLSGQRPGDHCGSTRRARLPLRALGMAACAVHREVLVDATRGVEVCGRCLNESTAASIERRTVVDWPPELAGWLERNVSAARERLPHDPLCRGAGRKDRSPQIVSPADGSRYHLVAGESFRQRLHFSAVAAADARKLYWFIDDELLVGAGSADEIGWDLSTGLHRVRCVDDRGRAAAVSFEVSRGAP